jgi:Na+/H+-dicarboxylate symporter
MTSIKPMPHFGMVVLAALGLGLAAGVAASWIGAPPGLSTALAWFVRVWTLALALVAIPLAVSQLFLAVARRIDARFSTARLGLSIPIVLGSLLVLAAVLALGLMSLALRLPGLSTLSLPSAPPAGLAAVAGSEATTQGASRFVLLPQQVLHAVLSANLVLLLAVTLVAALVVRWVAPARDRAVLLAQTLSAWAFQAVNALLWLAPAIVFAVGFGGARISGLDLGKGLAAYVVLKSGVTLTVIGALYGVAIVLGAPARRFAHAAGPGQVVALTTRSSLASLPALMSGATTELGLDPGLSGGLLGLAGAVLKLSTPVSNTCQFLFLAHILGVDLEAAQVGAFIVGAVATSVATVGVPYVTGEPGMLVFYVAAGIPLEYAVLLGTTIALTDPVATMLNSTAYLTFTVVACRLGLGRRGAGGAGRPSPGPPRAPTV